MYEPESNLISLVGREPEPNQPPDCFGWAVPSGIDRILSGSAATRSFLVARSSFVRPLTYNKSNEYEALAK